MPTTLRLQSIFAMFAPLITLVLGQHSGEAHNITGALSYLVSGVGVCLIAIGAVAAMLNRAAR